MKKLYFLIPIFIFLFSFKSIGQKIDYDNSSKWSLGLNIGGTWNTNDVKTRVNAGWGLTLGRTFNYNYGKIFSFDLRARYLHGYWKGIDQDTSAVLSSQGALSLAPTDYKNTLGYTVNNHKTDVHELGLELVMHFNNLNASTGLDPYIFGGANFSWYQAKGDLLNQSSGFDMMYDYSNLPNYSKGTLNSTLDNKFETSLDGSNLSGYKVKFMPSAGIGLGYFVGPRVSIGFEHKTTFTLMDQFDGLTSEVGRFKTDWYHYTSFYVNFRFRHNNHSHNETSNTTTNSPTNNNTNTFTQANCKIPSVAIISPNLPNAILTSQNTTFVANVKEIGSINNVTIEQNGNILNNLTYNSTNQTIEGVISLVPGTNTFKVVATNACGTDTKTTSIIYQPCSNPIITFTRPSQNGTSVAQAAYSLQVNIANVTNKNNIQFRQNGQSITNFTYVNNVLNANVTLQNGANTFEVIVSNECGTDNKTITINYQNCVKPTIVINNQITNGMTVSNSNLNFTATISQITNAQNVTLTNNGTKVLRTTFTNGVLSGNVTLTPGLNQIVLTATNECGTTTQTIAVNYNNCISPLVTITNNPPSGTIVYQPNLNLNAQVIGVNNSYGISITHNNNFIADYNYTNGIINSSLKLVKGLNTIVVSAQNACGTDAKTYVINYEECQAPVISFSNPNTAGSVVSNSSFQFSGVITNITNPQQINLFFNGTKITNFTYSTVTGVIQANVTLNAGVNQFQLNVSNACGTDSKSTNVDFVNCKAPSISFIEPIENGKTVQNPNYTFKAKLFNFSNSTSPVITFNNYTITNYTLDQNTGNIIIPTTLQPGVNNLVISYTNQCGTSSKSIQIVFDNCIAPMIQFTNPLANNTIVNTPIFNIKASLTNVTNFQNVLVSKNNEPLTDYSITNGLLTANTNLIPGANTFVISVSNACGNDVKTINVIYDDCKQPLVNFTNPSTNNIVVTSPQYTLNGTVTNATNSQTTLAFNGTQLSGIILNQGNFSQNVTLVQGNNTFLLNATNSCGTDQKQINITFRPCKTPSAIAINPNSENITAENSEFSFASNLLNINQNNQIQLSLNNQIINNFNFNPNSGQLITTVTLNEGTNTFVLNLNNDCGNWSKTYTVNFIPKPIVKAPEITFSNPSSCPFTTQEGAMTISGFVSNITQVSEVIISFGGQIITNYTAIFNEQGMSFSFNTNLSSTNSPYALVVTAGNAGGRRSSSCSINVTPEPKMTICHHPPGNTGNTQTIEIPISAWAAHQAHGDTEGACPAPVEYILICYLNPKTRKKESIQIPSTQWASYQQMGAVLGQCPPEQPDTTNQRKIAICHIPPGNTGNPQTIYIPESAWPAHQAHGDVLGPCTNTNGNSNGTNGNQNPSNGEGNTNTNGTSNPVPPVIPGNTNNGGEGIKRGGQNTPSEPLKNPERAPLKPKP